MSIIRVVCPKCRTTANVPASMTSVQCTGCGHVFAPGQATNAESANVTASSAGSDTGDGALPTTLIAVIAIIVVLLVGGIGTYLLLPSSPVESGSTTADAVPETSASSVAEESAEGESSQPVPDFRVVDLPESTRKKVYGDYRKLTASSVGKAEKLSKFGTTGESLGAAMDQTVKREVMRMSLIYGVSEDDIMQIVAEGGAKGW